MSYSLIVGLGNPGDRYRATRHNLGFEVLDRLCTMKPPVNRQETAFYRSATIKTGEGRLLLAWPMTFMNRSGRAVEALLESLELEPDQMLVVVDDFNLLLGTTRVRKGGSDGGHNGLASIIETLGHNAFPRLRLGIGPVPDGVESVEFVLSRFTTSEEPEVNSVVARATEAVIFGACHNFDEFMSRYNHNPALPE